MQFIIDVTDQTKRTALNRAATAYNTANSTALTDTQFLQLVCDQNMDAYVAVHTVAVLTKYQFLDRFTQEERVAIRAAALTDGVLQDFMEMLEVSGEVILANPKTAAGANYIESIGLVAAGRAAEILAV